MEQICQENERLKRENQEMERLKKENQVLKSRIFMLEDEKYNYRQYIERLLGIDSQMPESWNVACQKLSHITSPRNDVLSHETALTVSALPLCSPISSRETSATYDVVPFRKGEDGNQNAPRPVHHQGIHATLHDHSDFQPDSGSALTANYTTPLLSISFLGRPGAERVSQPCETASSRTDVLSIDAILTH
ncbi:hypothetical protein BX600DRAFT_440135 [Xylariales sp. PMI_506]|nr:hypothetical protein BX600DRAFT_440135 [Xylariales sp. PMI_506]